MSPEPIKIRPGLIPLIKEYIANHPNDAITKDILKREADTRGLPASPDEISAAYEWVLHDRYEHRDER